MDDRLKEIEMQLQIAREKVHQVSSGFEDDTKVRKFVGTYFEPLILIAKQNMITNCLKNEEINQLKDGIKETQAEV